MTIGEKIALRRRNAGLSQETLAGQLGVSRQAVSRWETNESLPDTEKVLQLCRIFGVSADDLLLDQAPETALKFNAARPLLPVWRRAFRHVYLGLGAVGVVLALVGLAGVLHWAVTTHMWDPDWGRFGSALQTPSTAPFCREDCFCWGSPWLCWPSMCCCPNGTRYRFHDLTERNPIYE